MADKIPLRILSVSGEPFIGEFQAGDTLGVIHGGTGTSSLVQLKDDLGLNSLTLSGDLEDIDPSLRAQLIVPSTGDSLVWNGTHWTTSGLQLESPLSSLTDVNITSVVNGETLVYFSSTGEWKNAVPISGGSAVDHGLLTGLGDDDHPQYVLSATNLALSSLVSSIEASTVALSSYIETNSGDHGLLTGLLDNDHPQYVLSSVFLASAIELSAQMELNEADILDIWEYLFTNAPYWGGDLSGVDHGVLSGLLDNDHPQYVLSATNQALSSLVTSVEGSTVDISSYIAANEGTWSTDNDTTDHTQLTNIGTNTHAQIDGHISDITKHFTVASIDHGSIAGLSDNDHPQYVLSSTNQALSSLVTSVEGSTVSLSSYIAANEAQWATDVNPADHSALNFLDANDHPQYVLSATNQALSSLVTSVEGSTVDISAYIAANETAWSTDNDTTDHTQLTNIGTNTHAQIDGHISDITKHFTVASIDHGSIAGLGDNDHPQYVLSATNQALSSLVTNVEGSTVSLSSYIAANEGAWQTGGVVDHSALSGLDANDHPQYVLSATNSALSAQVDSNTSAIDNALDLSDIVTYIEHGDLNGLSDNDHPQYVLSSTNQALSSLVTSVEGSTVSLSSYIAANEGTWSTDTDTTDHTQLTNIGTNTHAQIDGHISDITKHFTVASIDHGSIAGLGDNDHPQYVLSSTNQALSSLVTSVEGSTVDISAYIAANEAQWATDVNPADHSALNFLDANDHPQYVLSATNQALSSTVNSKVNKELVGHYIEPWEEGSGNQNAPLGWTTNGVSSLREFDTDPFGNQSIVWKAIDFLSGLGSEGGFNSGKAPADSSSLHRFSCFIKQENPASGTVYFGPYAYSSLDGGVTSNQVTIRASNAPSGTGNTNTYFISNQPMPSSDWYLAVVYLLPYQTETGPVTRQDTALYKVSTGEKVSFTIVDRMLDDPTAIGLAIRAYHYNNPAGTGDTVQFFQPRIDIVDGNEPSIADLLGIVPRTDYVLTSTNSALSAQVDANTSAIEDAYQLSDIEAFIDHGNIAGLSDNDHPQYVLSATNQALSSLVTSVEGSTVSLSSYIAANEAMWSSDADVSTLSGLGDVSFTDLSADQHLNWDGTNWVNADNDRTEMRVRNGTASPMSKGDAIAIENAHNQNLVNVILADASQTSAMPALGILKDDLAVGAEGIAITFGKAQGLNTSGLTEGATAYVSPFTPGTITETKPTDVSHLIQNIGIIMRAHQSNGAIKVTGIGRANDIDNQTRFDINEKRFETNLITKYKDSWVEGSGSQLPDWTALGSSNEDTRVIARNPFDFDEVVWKMTTLDGTNPGGGFETSLIEVDDDKSYRISFFCKSDPSGGDINSHLMAYEQDGVTRGVFRQPKTGQAYDNWYPFAQDLNTNEQWYLFVSHINKKSEFGIEIYDKPETGIYNVETGLKLEERIQTTWRDTVFDPSANTSYIKLLPRQHNAALSGSLYVYGLRVDLVTDDMPSVSEIIKKPIIDVKDRYETNQYKINNAFPWVVSSLPVTLESPEIGKQGYTWDVWNGLSGPAFVNGLNAFGTSSVIGKVDYSGTTHQGINSDFRWNAVNPHSTYRLSHYVKVVSEYDNIPTSHWYGYRHDADSYAVAGGGFYFDYDRQIPEANKWYLAVTYYNAYGTPESSPGSYIPAQKHEDTGYWDVETRTKVNSGAVEYIFHENVGSFRESWWFDGSLDGSAGDHFLIADPRIDIVTDNTPSIQELLEQGQFSHSRMTGLDQNDHPQYVLSSTNSALSAQVDSNTSAIDSALDLSDVSIEFDSLVSSIHHGSLSGLADNDHPQYVLSATNSALSSLVTSVEGSTVSLSSYIAANESTWSTDTDTTDHTQLTNIGTNTHTDIDNHISDITKHFTVASIDHGSIAGLSDNDHPQYVLSATNQALSSLVTSIETSTVDISSYIAANEGSWSTGGATDLSTLGDTAISSPTNGQSLNWNGTAWVNSTPATGVTDHGLLTGLADNDHPQYVLSSTNSALSSQVDANTADISNLGSASGNWNSTYGTVNSLSSTWEPETASEILTKIKTVDGAGSNLDADLLDGQQGSYYLNTGGTTQTKSGSLYVDRLLSNKSIDTWNWSYGDPSSVSEMPVLQGFTVKPKGYGDNGKGVEFRYDTIQTAYLLDEHSGATYNILEGSDPGETAIKKFTRYTNAYFNLNTYKSASNAWEIEFSGFTLGNSSNTSWKPLLLWHGSPGGNIGNITIEALEGDGTTWTTVFSGTMPTSQPDVIFPQNYYIISTGNLKGMRLRIENITNNCYLKMFGFTSRTSASFQWQMLKDGGTFYGDVDGKLDGVQEWYIQQDGDASFNTVSINGSPVISNTGAWTGSNLDHTTDLNNVGTNTHAQIDSHIADSTIHFTEASIDHTNISNVGTNTHAQIDSHISDITKHFTVASIDHGSIAGLSDNDHPQYVLSATNQTLSSLVTSVEGSTVSLSSYIAANESTWSTDTDTTDHTALTNIGTNTHAQIDSHIADITKHFTVASIDHGSIAGLSDNDHPQYVLSSTNQALSSLVTSVEGSTVSLSSYIAANESTWSTDNDTTDHTALTNIGTNTHAQIDTHIADSSVHFTEGSIDHTNITNVGTNTHAQIDTHISDTNTSIGNLTTSTVNLSGYIAANETTWATDTDTTDHTALTNIGTNTHAQIDSHIADSTIHFTEASIDHTNITNVGTNTHAQIDTHISNTNTSIGNLTTSTVNLSGYIAANEATWATDTDTTDHTALTNIGTNTHAQIDTHIADSTIHFTEASIDHTNITNVGTNTHAQIDTHISDTNTSIGNLTTSTVNLSGYIAANETTWATDTDTTDHTALTNIGTNTHAQIDSHIADSTIHFTEGSINHANITNVGTNTHAQIDTHIADGTVHFTEGSIDHTNITNVGTNTHAQIDTHISNHSTSATTWNGTYQTVFDNSGSWGGGGGVTDHGALTGLADNDHPQYVLSSTNAALSALVTDTVDVSSIFSGNITVTGTNPAHVGTMGTVDTATFGIQSDQNTSIVAPSIILSATTAYQFRKNGSTTYTDTDFPQSCRNWNSVYNTVSTTSGTWGGGGGGVAAGITVVNTGTDNIDSAGALVPLDVTAGYPAYGSYATDYSYTAGNSYVTINTAGTYEVTFNVAYTSTVVRWNGILKIYKGTGGASPSSWIGYGAGKGGYLRSTSGHNEASLSVTCLVTCSANDTIGGWVQREAATGTCTTVANETFMTIKRMA